MNKSNVRIVLVLAVALMLACLLFFAFKDVPVTANAATDGREFISSMHPVGEARLEYVCASPKYIEGRVQGWIIVNPIIGDKGMRHAGCPVVAVAPVAPVVVAMPPVVDTPVCTRLFLTTGPLVVGTPTSNGGVVTAVHGEWTIEERGLLLATGGRTFTVSFPSPVVVYSVALFDHDPKPGEQGWTLNGMALPVTGGGMWADEFKMNFPTSEITFDNGDDSAHIGICIL